MWVVVFLFCFCFGLSGVGIWVSGLFGCVWCGGGLLSLFILLVFGCLFWVFCVLVFSVPLFGLLFVLFVAYADLTVWFCCVYFCFWLACLGGLCVFIVGFQGCLGGFCFVGLSRGFVFLLWCGLFFLFPGVGVFCLFLVCRCVLVVGFGCWFLFCACGCLRVSWVCCFCFCLFGVFGFGVGCWFLLCCCFVCVLLVFMFACYFTWGFGVFGGWRFVWVVLLCLFCVFILGFVFYFELFLWVMFHFLYFGGGVGFCWVFVVFVCCGGCLTCCVCYTAF